MERWGLHHIENVAMRRPPVMRLLTPQSSPSSASSQIWEGAYERGCISSKNSLRFIWKNRVNIETLPAEAVNASAGGLGCIVIIVL